MEAGLVQPEGSHPVQASRVLHQRVAVIGHRPHHRRPANPKVAGDRRDRMGVGADPPAGLGPGPFGQHRPRTDRGRLFGPGPDPAGRLMTAPQARAPGQHDRAAADRQIAHPDCASAVGGGRHATAHAADHRGRGLDGELPLATHEHGRDELEAVQAEQHRPGRTTVLTHLGPPSCRRQTSARYARPQVAFGACGTVSSTSPRFMTKSPKSGALSLPAWSARSTTRSMFCLVLPGLTLTVDPF